jgi:cytochrome c peroxidase
MRISPAFALLLLLAACDRSPEVGPPVAESAPCDPVLPAMSYGYSEGDAPLPAHFAASPAGTVLFSDNTPPENRITNAGATLGRVLFYDPRLSANDSVSCSSCHRQELGFGDTLRFSPGVNGHHERRAMALANARFNPDGRFFWDERAPSLEAQVLTPIQDTIEMGMELGALEKKLSAEPFYRRLFAAAFGSPEATADGISRALAQFVRSLISSGSRFDAMYATGGAPDYSVLTAQEREGMDLFNTQGCVNCHRAVTQFADKANNTGLDLVPADSGAGQATFKPASLRNIAVRPPYMHDGRFQTLRQVVEFYDHEVQDTPDLDPRMRNPDGTVRRLGLTPEQIDALVAFMGTLTDSTFLGEERFSNPFPCRATLTTPSGRRPR